MKGHDDTEVFDVEFVCTLAIALLTLLGVSIGLAKGPHWAKEDLRPQPQNERTGPASPQTNGDSKEEGLKL